MNQWKWTDLTVKTQIIDSISENLTDSYLESVEFITLQKDHILNLLKVGWNFRYFFPNYQTVTEFSVTCNCIKLQLYLEPNIFSIQISEFPDTSFRIFSNFQIQMKECSFKLTKMQLNIF